MYNEMNKTKSKEAKNVKPVKNDADTIAPIDDDVVHYQIFSDFALNEQEDKLNVLLQEARNNYLIYLSRYLVDYIWQNDEFNLHIIQSTATVPAHLSGKVNYGDNVEDEWFIVFLLLDLSKNFTDISIRVYDGDGEILLIEAAETIPKWLNPNTSTNRVFIRGGALHIIPRPSGSSELERNPASTPTIRQALQYMRENESRTRADDSVQRDINKRVSRYPDERLAGIHYTHCYIPAGLAAVLQRDPAIISHVVQSFYTRDPIDLKGCVTFNHFRPGTRILRRVRMTRCLYAELMQQKFEADRRSGYTQPPLSTCTFIAHDLGLKLAHGAEILCNKCSDTDKAGLNASMFTVNKSDVRWIQFIAKLTDIGYFRGELEGSKLYKELEAGAEQVFIKSCSKSSLSNVTSDVARRLVYLLKSTPYDMEAMRQEEKSLPPPDDDSWMDITPEKLEEMLNKSSGSKFAKSSDFDVKQVAQSMNNFINKVSSHEGAEFPKGESDDIQFDPNSFMRSMQQMFEFDDDAHSGSSSEMDEYESEEELGDTPGSVTNLRHKPAARRAGARPGQSRDMDMQDYINAMDIELSRTTIAQSFVREGDEKQLLADTRPKAPPRKKKFQTVKQRNEAAAASAAASGPAAATAASPGSAGVRSAAVTATPGAAGSAGVGSGSVSRTLSSGSAGKLNSSRYQADLDSDDIDDEDDDFRPVNIDLNTVSNIINSYTAQGGMPGPATNILSTMGVKLPPPGEARPKPKQRSTKSKSRDLFDDDMDDL